MQAHSKSIPNILTRIALLASPAGCGHVYTGRIGRYSVCQASAWSCSGSRSWRSRALITGGDYQEVQAEMDWLPERQETKTIYKKKNFK